MCMSVCSCATLVEVGEGKIAMDKWYIERRLMVGYSSFCLVSRVKGGEVSL